MGGHRAMFEVIRYRNRGELTYYHTVIPYGAGFKKEDRKEAAPEVRRFGPFPTEAEANDFIEELEKDT